MRLRSLYRLSEAVVSVILATVSSEARCEDKVSRGKLVTEDTSVRQKQV